MILIQIKKDLLIDDDLRIEAAGVRLCQQTQIVKSEESSQLADGKVASIFPGSPARVSGRFGVRFLDF
jgi:hypothetical protein